MATMTRSVFSVHLAAVKHGRYAPEVCGVSTYREGGKEAHRFLQALEGLGCCPWQTDSTASDRRLKRSSTALAAPVACWCRAPPGDGCPLIWA